MNSACNIQLWTTTNAPAPLWNAAAWKSGILAVLLVAVLLVAVVMPVAAQDGGEPERAPVEPEPKPRPQLAPQLKCEPAPPVKAKAKKRPRAIKLREVFKLKKDEVKVDDAVEAPPREESQQDLTDFPQTTVRIYALPRLDVPKSLTIVEKKRIKMLVGDLDDELYKVREHANLALLGFGKRARPLLEAYLHHEQRIPEQSLERTVRLQKVLVALCKLAVKKMPAK